MNGPRTHLQDATDTYPELAEALADQEATEIVIDGEVVAFEGKQTSFARLQGRVQLTDPQQARDSARACAKGWEGVIAKRAEGSYTHGRSTDWLKFTCVRDRELVIGGFTEDLHAELADISTAESPFCDSDDLPRSGVHWVRPRLVAEIGFTEWTRGGRLRHPRYQGLRRDEFARDVVEEHR